MSRRTALILALVSLALFAAITADVLCHGKLQQLDLPLARWIHQHIPKLPHWLGAPAYLGGKAVTIPLVILAVASLVLLRRWRLAIACVAAAVMHVALINALKPLFAIPRPHEYTFFVIRHGYTYPSGHAMGSAVIFGTLAWILAQLNPRSARWFILAGIAIPLVVSAALLAVGVHYLTDILAGLTLGAAIVFTTIALNPRP